jgi:hypothetical protein
MVKGNLFIRTAGACYGSKNIAYGIDFNQWLFLGL